MGLIEDTVISIAALLTALLQALLEAAFGSVWMAHDRQVERLQRDLHRYQGKDRAKRLEKELLIQRHKYDSVVTLYTRLQEEVKRLEKRHEVDQAEVRELRAERRAAARARQQMIREHGAFKQRLCSAEKAAAAAAERQRWAEAAVAAAETRWDSAAASVRASSAAAAAAANDAAGLRQQLGAVSTQLQAAQAAAERECGARECVEAENAQLQEQVRKLGHAEEVLQGRVADLAAELACVRDDLGGEVDQLRAVLDSVMTERAALAARCSALESQGQCMEADYGQLRAWLEEVIQDKSNLEARIEALEGDKEEALDEKVALEGWVRGSVAEQTATCTRLASFQAQHEVLEAETVRQRAIIAALLLQLAQRDAEAQHPRDQDRPAAAAAPAAAAEHVPSLGDQAMQRKASAALPPIEVMGAMLRACSAPALSPRSEESMQPTTPAKPAQSINLQRQRSPRPEGSDTEALKTPHPPRPRSCKQLPMRDDPSAAAAQEVGLENAIGSAHLRSPAADAAVTLQGAAVQEQEAALPAPIPPSEDQEPRQHCDNSSGTADLHSRKETDRWLQEAFHVTATSAKVIPLPESGGPAISGPPSLPLNGAEYSDQASGMEKLFYMKTQPPNDGVALN